jgi:nitroreductase
MMASKIINGHKHIPYKAKNYTEKETLQESQVFFEQLSSRRSIRKFSSKTISKTVIENLIKTAATAPSGAHKQPWIFCAISNKNLKNKIRKAAETEERISYESRMSESWKKDLEQFATNWHKPFLEDAPWLIVVFKKAFDYNENQTKTNNYYVNESVGIACGILISAIHQSGLVTLTHTPSPMRFLTELLKRPDNERPFLLLPVGYPKTDTYVPDLKRKSLDEVTVFYE